MTKLVLDCDAVQNISDKIKSLSNEMSHSVDSILGYAIDDSDFDFASAKNSIALNVKGAEQKIKNTYKLINLVKDTHLNLQKNLKFTVPNIVTKPTPLTITMASSSKTVTTSPSSSFASTASVDTSASSSTSSVDTSAPVSSPPQSVVQTGMPSTNTIPDEIIKIKDRVGAQIFEIPEGLGKQHTYKGWQTITDTTSNQYIFRETIGMNFDEEGFGKVADRYVIACSSTFGEIGDLIDFQQSDGTIIKCIIGDIKSPSITYDNHADMWGQNDGECIIEFIVDKDSWYNSNQENPGSSTCHPEWNDYIISATNYGSYYDLFLNNK